jgi:predicted nucleic acid-binding protein
MSDPGPVVTDSGPLIALATAGQMDLLAGLYETVLVPEAVFHEVAWYGARRPGAVKLAAASWAIRVDLEVPPEALLAEGVGAGECELGDRSGRPAPRPPAAVR